MQSVMENNAFLPDAFLTLSAKHDGFSLPNSV